MKYLRLIWRVARRLVWETAMDNTKGLAAQMAYLLLFALDAGTLFFWHLLGLLRNGKCGGDRHERPARKCWHHSWNLFRDRFHRHGFTRTQPHARSPGRSPLAVQIHHLIFHAFLVRDCHCV